MTTRLPVPEHEQAAASRYINDRRIDGEETLRRAAVLRGEGQTLPRPALAVSIAMPLYVREGGFALYRGEVVEVRELLGTWRPRHLRGLSSRANTYWRILEIDQRRWICVSDVEERELDPLPWSDERAVRLRCRILSCEHAADRMADEGGIPC